MRTDTLRSAAALAVFPLASLTASAWTSVLGAQATTASVARLRITPAVRTIAVNDSLQLNVQALDGSGNVVPGAVVRFNAQGGRFQGAVDSLGWVRAGSPGTIPIAVTAMVPGGRPLVEKIEVRITPGPAARVTLVPAVSKLIAGQRLRLRATVLTASGDARDDQVTWTTSSPNVVRVSDGVLAAVAPGSATVTARV